MSETPTLSRPVPVDDLPEEGLETQVVATPEERAALARDFGLPAVEALAGRFKLVRRGRAVTVTGTVEGDVVQTCVVTLEPFPTHVAEAVEVKYVSPPSLPRGAKAPVEAPGHHERQTGLDEPDTIVDGRIDLGALTAEFLALGLDPYPRKPGAEFAFDDERSSPEASPFAALGRLKPGGEG